MLKPIRELTKKNTAFIWTSLHLKSFNLIKKLIAENVSLRYYNPKKKLYIEVDARGTGIGAQLLQTSDDFTDSKLPPDGIPIPEHLQPMAFSDKTLTQTERNYANNEHEMLAVIHGLERFHTYTFGRHVTVITDHKPLLSLTTRDICDIPPRMQRLTLRSKRYDYDLHYRPGRTQHVSDALSRIATHLDDSKAVTTPYIDIDVHAVSNFPTNSLTALAEATQKDETLQLVKKYVVDGWPETSYGLPANIIPYFSCRAFLSVLNGLILRVDRIVVPEVARASMLLHLHAHHYGLTKTLMLAQSSIYWPCMKNDITTMISQCEPCQKTGPNKPREAACPFPVPATPWSVLGADVFFFDGKPYLALVDYTSKFPVVKKLPSQSADALIQACEETFSIFGFPHVIVSDQGSNFISDTFQEYCASHGIQQRQSSSYHHQANGQVERTIQSLKRVMKRCKMEGTSFEDALLNIRTTPIAPGLESPAQILGLDPRTLLPKARYQENENVVDKLIDLKEKAKATSSAHSVPQSFVPAQPVYVQRETSGPWVEAEIVSVSKDPHHRGRQYQLRVCDTDRLIIRNCIHIKERKVVKQDDAQLNVQSVPRRSQRIAAK